MEPTHGEPILPQLRLDDLLAEFVPTGLNKEEIARIDQWPEGRGRPWR